MTDNPFDDPKFGPVDALAAEDAPAADGANAPDNVFSDPKFGMSLTPALTQGAASSKVPDDAKLGPNGLMWNDKGGYDPQSGELVIGGKPMGASSPVVAGATGVLNGVPIAGPTLLSGVQKGAAELAADKSGMPADQALTESQDITAQSATAYPKTNMAGNIVGAGAGTMAMLPDAALGLVGSLPARIAGSTVGGAGLGAADSAARGQSPIAGAETGAATGMLSPIVGAGVGAAARGIGSLVGNTVAPALSGVSSLGRTMLAKGVADETPQAIAEAQARLGPNGFLGELSPGLMDTMGGVADTPGAGKAVVRGAYAARNAEAMTRANDLLDQHFGPRIDMAALTKNDIAARSAAADPLYTAWTNTPIPPTPELQALTSRLDAAGVSSSAANKMAIQGVPGFNQWFVRDPLTGAVTLNTAASPTAQTFDYMKQGLDDKIGAALRTGENGQARLYQGLKSDLVNALDNHPDPNVAGVWKQARQAWSDPTSIMNAREAGQITFSKAQRPDELVQTVQNMSQPERIAFMQGARDSIGQVMDASTRGDTTARNILLAPASQAKLRVLLGKSGAEDLTTQLQAEAEFKNNTQNIAGGSQTAPKAQRVGLVTPDPGSGALNWWNQLYLDKPSTYIPGLSPAALAERFRGGAYDKARAQIAPLLTSTGPQRDEIAQALYLAGLKNQAINQMSIAPRNAATVATNIAGQMARRKLEGIGSQ